MDRRLLCVIACLLLSSRLFSAAPVVVNVGAASVNAGQPVTLQANVTDADGNLKNVTFSLTGPGISGTQTLSAINVTGASAPASTSWTAPATGLYTVTAVVADLTNATTSASSTFDVFAGTTTISPVTVPNGTAWMVEVPGQIITTENDTSATTDVQSGSNVILWSGGRVTLQPGFHAENGSFFWATVDHDMNGYSDQEEATDSDGDGIPDAWEVDHGLNPADKTDAAKLAADQSGFTNLQEYQAHRDPRNKADDAAMPSGYQLVLKVPNQYYGVQTSNWQITAVTAP